MNTTNSGDRTILVTGAGSGIGRACALRLTRGGNSVVALDQDADAAKNTADEVTAAGGQGTAIVCDITDTTDVRTRIGELDQVDVLINSAGTDEQKELADVAADDLRRLYEVNVVGLFMVTQAAIKRMPDGARIVNIGSRAYLGSPNHPHYVASKAAVTGLTRTLALELADRQIMVNAVAPGPVRTPLLDELPEKRLKQVAASYPGGRLPEPDDVARAVEFFADPATRFINGQILLLDGGRSVGLSPA